MMLAASLLRAAVAPSAVRAVSKLSTNGPRAVQQIVRARIVPVAQRKTLFVSASAQATAAKPRTRSVASKSSIKKATKPKKPAAKKKAPKKKAEPKLKPWEKRGEDGKLVPLPRATKPKRTNAFALFMQDRAKALSGDTSLQNATGKFDVTKLASKVSSEWKSLSDGEKQKYSADAERSHVQYERELERWRNSLTPDDIRRENAYISAQRKKGLKGTAKLRDPTRPKQPTSAFFVFYASVRKNDSQLLSLPIGEQSKEVAAQWRNLGPEEREPYERQANADRERYQREISEWKRSVDE